MGRLGFDLLPFLGCDPGTPAVWFVRGVEYSKGKFTKNFP